jgi:apolipoprotein D and lipocalin family protein
MKPALISIALAALVLCATGCPAAEPPETVNYVDVEEYMGKWYEIARYPVFFQKGLVGVTAEYSLNEDGTVKVVNKGYEGSLDGELQRIEGTARVADKETNAKLKVSFFDILPEWTDSNYWIIMLGDEYEYAVVSDDKRDNLWILSRTPQMEQERLDMILDELEQRGFDTSKLQFTPQPEEPAADPEKQEQDEE